MSDVVEWRVCCAAAALGASARPPKQEGRVGFRNKGCEAGVYGTGNSKRLRWALPAAAAKHQQEQPALLLLLLLLENASTAEWPSLGDPGK